MGVSMTISNTVLFNFNTKLRTEPRPSTGLPYRSSWLLQWRDRATLMVFVFALCKPRDGCEGFALYFPVKQILILLNNKGYPTTKF